MGIFKKKKEQAELEASAASASQTAADELIAVIAAAIAAYGADPYKCSLTIRKLDRTAAVRPAWGVAGTNEAIDVRRI